MTRHNTTQTYGTVTRTFHWLTALLIIAAFPLGLIGSDLAHAIPAAEGAEKQALISRAMLVFTWHKTLGITAFFVALMRIIWTMTQPKPGLINGNKRGEAFMAELVHWLLYGSMIVIPLSGWITHAASSVGAPIWWPFGQGLPGVPKSETVAHVAGAVHEIGKNVLFVAVALHVAGALKHHIIDKDATLRRMGFKGARGIPSAEQPGHVLPMLVAVTIFAAVFLLAGWGTLIGGNGHDGHDHDGHDHGHQEATEAENTPTATATNPAAPLWAVTEGEIALTIRQNGSAVAGKFTAWSADITYDPDATGKRGAVTVVIPIESLKLGSVTSDAMGAEYFDAASYPNSIFTADLMASDDQVTATGTLEIKDETVPLSFPVALVINGDTATASGTFTLDRRDFNIGAGVSDEGTLGFEVQIAFNLTAQRAEKGAGARQ